MLLKTNYQYRGNNKKIDRQYKKWYLYYLPILEGYNSNQVLHFALLCFKIKSVDILGKVCRYINYSILISHMGLNKLVSRQFSCVQSWNLITLSFWASELNFFPLFSQKENPAQKKFAVEFFSYSFFPPLYRTRLTLSSYIPRTVSEPLSVSSRMWWMSPFHHFSLDSCDLMLCSTLPSLWTLNHYELIFLAQIKSNSGEKKKYTKNETLFKKVYKKWRGWERFEVLYIRFLVYNLLRKQNSSCENIQEKRKRDCGRDHAYEYEFFNI